MARSRHTNLRIPAPMWERVKAAAAREDVSAAEWIRQAIVARLAWDRAAQEAQRGADLRAIEADAISRGEELVDGDG